jgi:hypothetical protein
VTRKKRKGDYIGKMGDGDNVVKKEKRKNRKRGEENGGISMSMFEALYRKKTQGQ